MNAVEKRLRPKPAVASRKAHGAMNKWRHVCARRRDGEPAVSWYRDPLRSVEETEREKPRQASGSAAVAGIHELCWLDPPCPLKEVDSV
jgi:hypothetical protein